MLAGGADVSVLDETVGDAWVAFAVGEDEALAALAAAETVPVEALSGY